MSPSSAELRRLYVREGLTTREIGRRYGVAHITVRRWLTKHEIPVRPPGRGLANRGIRPPTTRELERMLNDQGLTYREVGNRYGVDQTAVTHWVRKHGITVAERIPTDEIKARYATGESANSIAEDLGCAKTTVLNVLRRAGIERRASGWRAPLISKSGCPVRSTYELRVADWLTDHGRAFEYEPDVPFGHGNTRADFFVNGWYIEVWGVHSSASYSAQRKRKQRLYAEHNLPLIELSPHHFSRDRHIMERRLRQTLQLP